MGAAASLPQPTRVHRPLSPLGCSAPALYTCLTRWQLHCAQGFGRWRETNHSVAWYTRLHHALHRQAGHQQVLPAITDIRFGVRVTAGRVVEEALELLQLMTVEGLG